MEDILSSIKRIIAEDSDAALSGTRARRAVAPARSDRQNAGGVSDQDDVLELTDAIDAAPAAPSPPARSADAQAPRQEVPAAPLTKATSQSGPATVSASTVEASRSSLAALSALVVKPDVAGSDTLEGMVREMLRPMIAQWLDARLPEIVERHVAQEVRRIADRG